MLVLHTNAGVLASSRLVQYGEVSVEDLLEPLSARSLLASALLGSHPPKLRGSLLVAFGGRFGINEGTIRVALSRMVERGELANINGYYQLEGKLLERQERQDRSRTPPRSGRRTPWNGTWEQAVVTVIGRPASQRARLRRSLTALGLGELREGVWMRPANLDEQRLPRARAEAGSQVNWFTVNEVDQTTSVELVNALFELDQWEATAGRLIDAIDKAVADMGADDAMVSGFKLASATVRHLVHDPLLPHALTPKGWPADELRTIYGVFESSYQQQLRQFFAAA